MSVFLRSIEIWPFALVGRQVSQIGHLLVFDRRKGGETPIVKRDYKVDTKVGPVPRKVELVYCFHSVVGMVVERLFVVDHTSVSFFLFLFLDFYLVSLWFYIKSFYFRSFVSLSRPFQIRSRMITKVQQTHHHRRFHLSYMESPTVVFVYDPTLFFYNLEEILRNSYKPYL